MFEQFEQINMTIDSLEKFIDSLKVANEDLRRQIAEQKSIIEDKELEIMQLQENAEKEAAANKAFADEVSGGLTGLLTRIGKLAPIKNDAANN